MENISSNTPNFHLTVKNYRCFPDNKPVHISMRNGFTAFVGVNNSGKSSLLKMFYELRNLFALLSNPNNFLNALKNPNDQEFSPANTIQDINEICCNANSRDIYLEIKLNAGLNNKQNDGVLPEKIVLIIRRGRTGFTPQIFLPDNKYLDIKKPNIPSKVINNVHIKVEDTLVDLEAYLQIFKALSGTVYIGPFRNAVNIGSKENYYDMTIGQKFIELWRSHKSGNTIADIVAALRLTHDLQDIFRFKNLEINASTDNQTLHVIVDGKPYRLEELGSGLAQFIVILANIAIKKPSWILIDEPELNLHPSLQIAFLTTLASYATEGIIFSTHNIGLARASADCIYSFHTDEEGQNEVKDFETIPRLSEFLGELSYAGYKDIGSRKVLLVEGSSEVRTIQQFLRKYGKDHKIVLLSLGGNDLIKPSSSIELEEIKRITDGNISALIDSERKSSDDALCADRQAFFNNCKEAHINCRILERRAIENYFSDRAIKVIKGEKYQALNPYEKLGETSPSWGKQENWRIAREMNLEEINNTDLGKFLLSL
ncbi:ATP-dependent endonuclease [Chloroflexota bacterium]